MIQTVNPAVPFTYTEVRLKPRNLSTAKPPAEAVGNSKKTAGQDRISKVQSKISIQICIRQGGKVVVMHELYRLVWGVRIVQNREIVQNCGSV